MDIDNENKSLQVNLYQERYLFKIHDTNLDDLSECVKQALGSKSINNTQHDTTKKRSRKSGSSCYFRGMRGYISISKSSGFRRLPGTAIFL